MKRTAFSLIELSIVILVVGILIAGVTQGSILVEKMRLSSARTLTQSSPVLSIKDLSLWVESTSEVSFIDSEVEDGSNITKWYDLNSTSQYRNDFNAMSAPTYSKDCINGLPCVHFDGATQYMETIYDAGRDYETTIFAVFSQEEGQSDSYGTILVTKEWDRENNSIWFYAYDSGEVYYEEEDYVGNDITYRKPYIISVVDKNTQYEMYVNGLLSDAESSPSEQYSTTDVNHLQIGAWNDSSDPGDASEFFKGGIAEVIVFRRALKNSERTAIEKYLGQKWNIAVTKN